MSLSDIIVRPAKCVSVVMAHLRDACLWSCWTLPFVIVLVNILILPQRGEWLSIESVP